MIGKSNAKVEFGAKIDVSVTNGFVFLDEYSWDAYNEGTTLIATVEIIVFTKLFPKNLNTYSKKNLIPS